MNRYCAIVWIMYGLWWRSRPTTRGMSTSYNKQQNINPKALRDR